MRAVIIGAGIGGLAAAVALRKVGVEVLVVERAPAIQETSSGLPTPGIFSPFVFTVLTSVFMAASAAP